MSVFTEWGNPFGIHGHVRGSDGRNPPIPVRGSSAGGPETAANAVRPRGSCRMPNKGANVSMISSNMNKNGEKTKLLAVIAVFAMVLCAMAAVMPAADAAGDDETSYKNLVTPSATAEDVYTLDGLKDALENEKVTEIVINTADKDGKNTSFAINENLTIPEGKKVFIGETYIPNGVMGTDNAFVADGTTFTLTIGEDVTITVAGEIYNNIGKNKATVPIVLNGNIEFDGGALYSVCALPGATGHVTGAFFTNSNGNTKWTDGGYNNIQYKHMYSSDVADILSYVNSVAYNNVNVSGDKMETAAKAIFTYGDVTVSKALKLDGVKLVVGGVSGADATVTFAKGVQFDGTVMNAKDGSSAAIAGLKAGEDGFTIGQGSIAISGTFTGSAITIIANGQVEIDGEVVKDGTTNAGIAVSGSTGDVVVSDNLVIPEGATLTVASGASFVVNSGATVSNAGTIAVTGTMVNGGSVTGEGAVTLTGTLDVLPGSVTNGVTKSGTPTITSYATEGSPRLLPILLARPWMASLKLPRPPPSLISTTSSANLPPDIPRSLSAIRSKPTAASRSPRTSP